MNKRFILIGLIATFSLASFATVLAQSKATEYQLLAPISQISQTAEGQPCIKDGKPCATTAGYIPGLFRLMISIATGLAVLMLIYAGIKYISTDSFSGTEEAKGIISNALYGLLLAIAAWLIVYTIDPNLISFNLSIPVQEIKATIPGGSGGGGGSNLTQAEVAAQLTGKVVVNGPIVLAGLRQATIDEVLTLKSQCGCTVTITSATGGTHKDGEFDHAAGYKVDLRSRDDGSDLTSYITSHFAEQPARSNKDQVFRAPTGALYVWETHKPSGAGSDWAPHWDVTVGG